MRKLNEEERLEKTKKKSKGKSYDEAVVRSLVENLVQLAVSSKKVVLSGSFSLEGSREALLLHTMAEQVLQKFTTKRS